MKHSFCPGGFTLLEVMLATAVSVVLLISAYQVNHQLTHLPKETAKRYMAIRMGSNFLQQASREGLKNLSQRLQEDYGVAFQSIDVKPELEIIPIKQHSLIKLHLHFPNQYVRTLEMYLAEGTPR